MGKVIKKIDFIMKDEFYEIIVIDDGNRLYKYEIMVNGVPVVNVYQQLRRLNVLLDMQIDYIPEGRTKLNTREFATKVTAFLENKKLIGEI